LYRAILSYKPILGLDHSPSRSFSLQFPLRSRSAGPIPSPSGGDAGRRWWRGGADVVYVVVGRFLRRPRRIWASWQELTTGCRPRSGVGRGGASQLSAPAVGAWSRPVLLPSAPIKGLGPGLVRGRRSSGSFLGRLWWRGRKGQWRMARVILLPDWP
jgi:hypothetical protein